MPSFTSWNAIAVLTVSMLISVFLLVAFAAGLLLFASNLDDQGRYLYRDIAAAKDITEEVGIGEVDITSDEAVRTFSVDRYPWLYSPLPSADLSSGGAVSNGSSIVDIPSLPDRDRY
eukprot:IDg19080t1